MRGAILKGADLSNSNFTAANFYFADLSGANLSRAILIGADLHNANLSGANLSGCILSKDKLSYIDLGTGYYTDVANASSNDLVNMYVDWKSSQKTAAKTLMSILLCLKIDISGKDLSGGDLSGLDLSGCNLSGCNISGTDFSSADLRKANLANVVITDKNYPNLRCARISDQHTLPDYPTTPDLLNSAWKIYCSGKIHLEGGHLPGQPDPDPGGVKALDFGAAMSILRPIIDAIK